MSRLSDDRLAEIRGLAGCQHRRGEAVTAPLRCPVCGGYDPFGPDEPKCSVLKCSAWVVTDRLTKQGKKPLRPDGRADLAPVKDDA